MSLSRNLLQSYYTFIRIYWRHFLTNAAILYTVIFLPSVSLFSKSFYKIGKRTHFYSQFEKPKNTFWKIAVFVVIVCRIKRVAQDIEMPKPGIAVAVALDKHVCVGVFRGCTLDNAEQ